MTAETAVTRLKAALDPWAPGATEDTITLSRLDAAALMKIIGDLCEDHGSCEECETDLCETCVVGEASTCDHDSDRILCSNCWEACPDCRYEAWRDEEGDRQHEWAMTGGL